MRTPLRETQARRASRILLWCFFIDQLPCARSLRNTTCIGRRTLTGRSSLRRPRRRSPPCSVRRSSVRTPGAKSESCTTSSYHERCIESSVSYEGQYLFLGSGRQSTTLGTDRIDRWTDQTGEMPDTLAVIRGDA